MIANRLFFKKILPNRAPVSTTIPHTVRLPVHRGRLRYHGSSLIFRGLGTYKPPGNHLFNLGVFYQSEPVLKDRFLESRVFWRITVQRFRMGRILAVILPLGVHTTLKKCQYRTSRLEDRFVIRRSDCPENRRGVGSERYETGSDRDAQDAQQHQDQDTG